MMKRLSSFLRDSDGAVTIELAMVAPILAAMLIGLVDLGNAYSKKLRLEQVAQRTVEKVMQNSFKVADAATLKTEAETGAGTGATATVTFWLECNGVTETGATAAAAFASECADGEQYSRHVQVSIVKPHTAIIMNKTWNLVGVAGIRIQ
jgi:Flp pilus assembly protein TadG